MHSSYILIYASHKFVVKQGETKQLEYEVDEKLRRERETGHRNDILI